MRRTISFIAGLTLAGAAFATPYRNPELKPEACKMAGLTPHECAAFEADHKIPLCLEKYLHENLDIIENIQLQPWPEARRKDKIEKEVCAAVRYGRMSPQAGRAVFSNHKGAW